MTPPAEPTVEQCSNHEKVAEDAHSVSYAIWYPQMGGYVGKAVAVFDRRWFDHTSGSANGGCIEVYVWHDGEFPFSEQDGSPALLHHCDPEQFIRFGQKLAELNELSRVVVDDRP
jgi:hypothetical protein